jgi:hypothetical protein
MATAYFEETQRLRDNRWVVVLIMVVVLAAIVPLLSAIYWQIGEGEAWGNQPMKDRDLIGLSVVVFLCTGIVMFMLFNLRLETRIDDSGIHFRMFPVKSKWRLVNPADIAEYSFKYSFKFFESGGIGHHRSLLKKTQSFRIHGGKHISIKTRNGFRLLIGTQKPTEMEWAMRKLMNKTKD